MVYPKCQSSCMPSFGCCNEYAYEGEKTTRSRTEPTRLAVAASSCIDRRNYFKTSVVAEANRYVASPAIQFIYTQADIFTIGPKAIIIHACNTRGFWGSGIALSLKQRYPQQYQTYQQYCQGHSADELLGTSLLLGPSDDLATRSPSTHWIGCLFTNKDIGKDAHTQSLLRRRILADTTLAMTNLLKHVTHARQCGMIINAMHMPKINSGSFRIPWPETVKALEDIAISDASTQQPWQMFVHSLANR